MEPTAGTQEESVEEMGKRSMLFGIPTMLLVSATIISVACIFLIGMFIGIVFAICVLGGLFAVHKDDPDGLAVWTARLVRRWDGYEVGKQKRPLIVLNKGEAP